MLIHVLEGILAAFMTGIVGFLFYILKKMNDKVEKCVSKTDLTVKSKSLYTNIDRLYLRLDVIEGKLDTVSNEILYIHKTKKD